MYQEEAICNREIYKNAEINVLKLNPEKCLTLLGLPQFTPVFKNRKKN
jgi:hypothetical protein